MSDYYSDPYAAIGVTEEALGELGDQVNPNSGAVELSEEENTISEYDAATSSGHEATTVAMEGFSEKFQTTLENLRSEERPELGDVKAAFVVQQKVPQYHILSNDNRVFRIYFRSDIWFRDKEVNSLCRFLDTRSPGPIVSAIMTCKAKTVGMAMGLCSLPETMIWSYCAERKILRYGAVCYSRPELIKHYPEYKPYYDEAFRRGVKIGIITDADVEQIYAKNAEIMKMYSDLHQV